MQLLSRQIPLVWYIVIDKHLTYCHNSSMPFDPEWKKYEKDIRSDDKDKAVSATDKFIASREHAIKTDSTAKKWEESRKKSVAKEKPYVVKQRIRQEQEAYDAPIKKLLVGGSYERNIKPSPGYLVVKIEKVEEVTGSGIVLAQLSQESPNTGVVVDVGDTIRCIHCFTHPHSQPLIPTAKIGDSVIFKRGAGLEITVKEARCRFMAFSDILGVFYNE